jgi:hypothetical protein
MWSAEPSATPLWPRVARARPVHRRAKAPSPLRSAGALHKAVPGNAAFLASNSAADVCWGNLLQGFDRPVGALGAQFVERVTARGYHQGLSVDRPRALQIARGVANDQDFVSTQVVAKPDAGPVAGDARELVSILMVVAERAGFKSTPQPVMAQLDARAESDVAGQEPEQWRRRPRGQGAEPGMNAGQHSTVELAQ